MVRLVPGAVAAEAVVRPVRLAGGLVVEGHAAGDGEALGVGLPVVGLVLGPRLGVLGAADAGEGGLGEALEVEPQVLLLEPGEVRPQVRPRPVQGHAGLADRVAVHEGLGGAPDRVRREDAGRHPGHGHRLDRLAAQRVVVYGTPA